jgi:formiminoglutamate deiminase
MKSLRIDAFASAHSHAFQRAMRGQAQRPGPAGTDDFWTWRTAMYALADRLTPEQMHAIARVAYRELHQAGVRTVGEFHYVHHQPGGVPYDDRTVLAEAVIQAARDEGLRIALLRVVYARAGAGRAPEGAQKRFSDTKLDDAFSDIESLERKYAGAADVRIGIAPHSVRAVPPDWLAPIAKFAEARSRMVHMHVAEQPGEIRACLEETKKRPVELLADHGLLSERFVAVHATHLAPHEPVLLGAARSFVCLCPTTERDLGDGLPDVGALLNAKVRLCVGVDSHVMTSQLEDLRAIELGERLRTGKRVVSPLGDHPAKTLLEIGSSEGAAACGFEDVGGTIGVNLSDPSLALVSPECVLDALVFGGDARAIQI